MSQQQTYRKLPESISTDGPEYEKAILTLVYTWCLNNDVEFHLASNMKIAKPFDDVVLLIRNTTHEKMQEKEYSLLLLQAGYLQNYKPTRKLMLKIGPGRVKDKLLVENYFQSCLELDSAKIIEELGLPVSSHNEMYGLCTNASLNGPVLGINSFRAVLPQDLCSKLGNVESFSLTDADVQNKMPRWTQSKNTQCLQKFFARFRFFHGHDAAEFNRLAAVELESLFGPDARPLFPELRDGISKWWEKKGDSVEVLTRSTGPAGNIGRHVIDSLCSEYVGPHISEIIFNDECLKKYRNQLERCGEEITFLADEGASSLTACKLHQALSNELHIIGSVEKLRRHKETVSRMWRRHCPWLVVVEEAGQDARALLPELEAPAGRRRLALVTQRRLHGAVVDSCVPADLSPRTLLAVPRLPVRLQGDQYAASLGDLLPHPEAIARLLEGNGGYLLRLLGEAARGQPLRLGRPLPAAEECHVPRKLVSCRMFHGDTFFRSLGPQDVCVTDDFSIGELLLALPRSTSVSCQDVVNYAITPETEWPLVVVGNDRSQVYQMFADKNVYEVTHSSAGWELLRCSKGMTNIRKFLLYGDKQDDEISSARKNYVSFLDLTERVVIIEGKPGVGKSSLLTSVAVQIKQRDTKTWVLRINLLSYTKLLKQHSDCKEIIRIILKDAMSPINKSNDGLESAILQECLRSASNVVILLDGFDEISPDYTEKCFDIIELLRHQCRCLCVTTRPTVARELEDKLGVVAYILEVYTIRELQEVFRNYRNSGLVKELLDANELNEQFRNILRIPLFAKIYADLVAADKLRGHDSVTLFEEFFEMKYQRLFEQKYSANLSVPGAKEQMESDRRAYMNELMQLAGNSLLDYRVSWGDAPTFKHKLSYFLKPGIVFDFVDGRPVFLHRTFAEFFLAKWCIQNVDNCGVVFQTCFLEYKLEFFLECFTRMSCRGKLLHEAVINNDTLVVKQLLSSDIDALTTEIDDSGRNALHVAVIHDRWKMVRIIAQVHTEFQMVSDRVLRWTPLQYAQSAQRWGIIGSLLQAGVSPDVLTLEEEWKSYTDKQLEEIFHERGYTALLKTVLPEGIIFDHEAQFKVAISIIKSHFNTSCLSKDGKTLLQCALGFEHRQVVRTLVIAGADLTAKGADGSSILHSAVEQGDADTVALLLEAGVGRGDDDVDWRAVLRLAAVRRHLRVAEYLVRAMLDVPRQPGWTTLHLAASCGNILALKALLDTGGDAHARDTEGSTVLHVAASHGHAEAVELLLQRGCSQDEEDANGNTPIAVAAMQKHFAVVEVLAAAKLALPRRPEWSFLHWAAACGDAKVVRALEFLGDDINSVDLDGSTVLHLAAAGGHKEVVQLLLQWNADLRAEDFAGRIPLAVAVEQGQTQIQNDLADALIKEPTRSGWNNLHKAAYKGDLQVLRALLCAAATPTVLDDCGCSPLLIASIAGHVQCARLLLEKGADVNLANRRGTTPLMSAAERSAEMVDELLSWKADHAAVDQDGQTALHKAAAKNMMEGATYLILAGIERERVDKEGRTALLIAAELGNKEVIRALMAGGCRADTKNADGYPAVHIAIKNNHVPTAKTMIGLGADIEAKDANGMTVIAFAAKKGQAEVVELLLGLLLEPRETNWSSLHWVAFVGDDQAVEMELLECDDPKKTVGCNLSSVHVAAARGWPKVVKKLLLWGLSAVAVDSSGWTPLHYAAACSQSREETVRALLHDPVADVMRDAPSGDSALSLAGDARRLDVVIALATSCLLCEARSGWTYMHLAVECRNAKVLKALITAGHNVNHRDNDGCTPLHVAAAAYYVEGAKILLQSHANLEEIDNSGCTPLVVTTLRGQGEMMLFLLKAGADPNSAAPFGYTHLHIETLKGDVARVKWILDNGGNVNELTNDNWTPIMIAACIRNLEMVKCLRSYGADLRKTNVIKWTALHYAARNGPPEVVKFLIDHKSDINAMDVQNWKPIHVAARYCDDGVVAALLAAGAHPQDRLGRTITPLLLATAQGQARTVRLLLEAGARVDSNVMETLVNDVPSDGDESSKPEVGRLLLGAGAQATTEMVRAARRWKRHQLADLLEDAIRRRRGQKTPDGTATNESRHPGDHADGDGGSQGEASSTE